MLKKKKKKKEQKTKVEVENLRILRFFIVTRMEMIRIEFIRGTAQVEWFGDKARESWCDRGGCWE